MFKLEAFFNPYLPSGQSRLDAVLTITADPENGATPAVGSKRVIGFVLDTSGSMANEKLASAKLALRRCIDLLDANTHFFVVRYNLVATVVVPVQQASAENKACAHQLVQQLNATGGTALSAGLLCAKKQIESHGEAMASVYFLTDGENSAEDRSRLAEAIETCKGAFQCDCRGVGTDWHPAELRAISTGLLGNADAVPNPAALERDFHDFLQRSLSKDIAGARLRLWTPKVVRLAAVKQVSPEIVDLQPLATHIDEKTTDYPLGAWGKEARDYQLTFEINAGAIGEEVLLCRPALMHGEASRENKVTGNPIVATWSDDAVLTTRINGEVAHYTGQSELAEAIQEGLEAKARGEDDRATRLLGRAAQLAAGAGNEEVTRRLRKVVDVVDALAGTVRLRKADKAADLELEMGGTRTVRKRSQAAANS